MSQFHNLKVSDVRNETEDTVSIAFEIPESLKGDFAYKAGQYLTVKAMVNGSDERRAYSLCSSPSLGEDPRIAVKRVENGKVSNYLNDQVSVGDMIEVMPPNGMFVLTPEENKTYVGFAAGSGITPIISMIKTVLEETSSSKFVLFYGNKTEESTIFKSELDQLSGSGNFTYYNVLTREDSGKPLTNGRINEKKAITLLKDDMSSLNADGFFMCGPEQMIFDVVTGLKNLNIDESKVHYELFTTPDLLKEEDEVEVNEFSGVAKVKVIYDDEEVEFDLAADGDDVLEAAMQNDLDVPFSCKGAVCCTCKAKVTEGKMIMDANYALSDEEVAEGFVLTCQAHPASGHVVVDFDEA